MAVDQLIDRAIMLFLALYYLHTMLCHHDVRTNPLNRNVHRDDAIYIHSGGSSSWA